MKVSFVRREASNTRLIIIYAGWNTDPTFYSDVNRDGWDLAIVYEYSDISPLPTLPSQYTTIYLYAWSFGVKVAEATAPSERISRAFAIAGTPEGIDDSTGIPTAIFQATRDSLSETSLKKFRRRMLSAVKDAALRETLLSRLPQQPSIENLRNQLDTIQLTSTAKSIRWDRAYIPEEDLIIPTLNQRNSWQKRLAESSIIMRAGGHWQSISEIVEETISDRTEIAHHFSKALPTYSRSAHAQMFFAERLAERIKEMNPASTKSLLEIGHGSGIFSRLLAQQLPMAEATLVDLYPTTPLRLFKKETYPVADAETWLQSQTSIWDLIVSSSALQWFADLPQFFATATNRLSDSGLLACSILTRGTLHELDTIRRSPIHYYSGEELTEIAKRYFREVEVKEYESVITFSSPREALLHLRATGVSGGSHAPLADCLRALRDGRLTYRAAILTAKK